VGLWFAVAVVTVAVAMVVAFEATVELVAK
jgi:hypothetical protein